jgi:hypothetical protein
MVSGVHMPQNLAVLPAESAVGGGAVHRRLRAADAAGECAAAARGAAHDQVRRLPSPAPHGLVFVPVSSRLHGQKQLLGRTTELRPLQCSPAPAAISGLSWHPKHTSDEGEQLQRRGRHPAGPAKPPNPRLMCATRHRRLDAVPVQHQKMRRKALRLLLRHTDEAVDELRDDNDEMLRGGCTRHTVAQTCIMSVWMWFMGNTCHYSTPSDAQGASALVPPL